MKAWQTRSATCHAFSATIAVPPYYWRGADEDYDRDIITQNCLAPDSAAKTLIGVDRCSRENFSQLPTRR